MTDNYAVVLGNTPIPTGIVTGDNGEYVPAQVAGLCPEPTGIMEGTVASDGDRTPFVTIQDPVLAGFKHISRGPGFLIAGAGTESNRVYLIDATGFRSLRIESTSEELDGEVAAMESAGGYIFAYTIDKEILMRRLYILENASGLNIVATLELDDDEIVSWISTKEDAGVVAFPVGAGRVQVRSTISPFAILGEVEGIGRSAVALWTDIPDVYVESGAGVPPPPPSTPTDYASLWDLSKYVTAAANSWTLPAYILPDDGPDNIALTILNPKSDGASTSRIVTLEPQVSAPDGVGAWAINRPQQLTSDTAEIWHGLATGSIDPTADPGFSLGGWHNPNDWAQLGGNVLMSQNTGAGNDLFLDCYISTVTYPTAYQCRYRFQCEFVGVGSPVMIETADMPLSQWRHVWVNQTATDCEIIIDGVQAAYAAPVGATAINANLGANFRMWGNVRSTGTSIDARGGLGQKWYRFRRALDLTEIQSFIDASSNWDGTKLISDIGDFGQAKSNNDGNTRIPYTTDRVTYDANVTSGSPSSYGTSFMANPMYRGVHMREFQFRVHGTGNPGRVGLSGDYYGTTGSLGSTSREYGLWIADRSIWHNGSKILASGTAIGDQSVITVRVDCVAEHVYWLIDNVAIFDHAMSSSVWTYAGNIKFTCGVSAGPFTGGDHIELIAPADAPYPVGVGFEYSRST